MARPLSDILKDADTATELQTLIDLWNELAYKKYSYTLVQLNFANEHIRELVLKAKGSDFAKGRFYWELKSMYITANNL